MVIVRSQISSTLSTTSQIKNLLFVILQNWIDELPTEREPVYELIKSGGDWVSANFTNEAIILLQRVRSLKKN
ncbi:hypothetical protein [Bacillus pakistanensis]|uniref:hypothetical protein n=1 Tax=Rossellomorea pakistanensis TaxID=992288 RepID=UPI0019628445|nr:hypothetical protein [Bacillus pakistanensis]